MQSIRYIATSVHITVSKWQKYSQASPIEQYKLRFYLREYLESVKNLYNPIEDALSYLEGTTERRGGPIRLDPKQLSSFPSPVSPRESGTALLWECLKQTTYT